MHSPSQPPDTSDAEAIIASLDRPAAFDAVFERHVATVHAFAQRRIGADLAEDVTAETFARAFASRKRFDRDQSSARPWLLGIASNVMRRHWRTERRRLAAYAKTLNDDRPGSPPTEETAALAALARLPLRQREVVLLHAWGDLSYDEIARALDVPIGTVRSRLARARRSLTYVDGAVRPRPPLNDTPESSHA
jgi:RNA polymerase sigma-70 factor (ECF subfamily)